MLNEFPRWKYWLLAIVLCAGLIYALPNIYGEDPAVQVIGTHGAVVNSKLQTEIAELLKTQNIKYKSVRLENNDSQLLIRFNNIDSQLLSKDLIKNLLGKDYSVALNLAPATPKWLSNFGAEPMKLGLDLRGGVRFLMSVDVETNIARRLESHYNDLRVELRKAKIQYSSFSLDKADGVINIAFDNSDSLNKAKDLVNKSTNLTISSDNNLVLSLKQSDSEITQIRNNTMEQTVATLRNRVNELGVAESIVQREGLNKVVVELPGIQDSARAKDILGKTATLDFYLEDSEADMMQAMRGKVPPGSKIYYDKNNRPYVLKNRVILSGDSIVSATSQYDSKEHQPIVAITLGGSNISLFRETTINNIGKNMAVVFRESNRPDRVISFATILSALDNNFQISGMSEQETRELALLLRAGALPANVSIIEERVIGPSMGQENIDKGITSVMVGFGLVIAFMTAYYSVFGIVANIALLFNLILLVSLLSLLGATLTLPGIAGIVLTLGMAVDANVLIFERIREELRNGISPHTSIMRGFEHAFSTIVDSNLTTLIVGIILYSIGTGPVKGFAVTLSLGILTSMFTAVTGTRAMIELLYGKRQIKKLRVGI